MENFHVYISLTIHFEQMFMNTRWLLFFSNNKLYHITHCFNRKLVPTFMESAVVLPSLDQSSCD